MCVKIYSPFEKSQNLLSPEKHYISHKGINLTRYGERSLTSSTTGATLQRNVHSKRAPVTSIDINTSYFVRNIFVFRLNIICVILKSIKYCIFCVYFSITQIRILF